MKKLIVAALGATLTVAGLSAGLAGPGTLVVPPDTNPVTAATAQCQERAEGLAVVFTASREDGTTRVVYRCEKR